MAPRAVRAAARAAALKARLRRRRVPVIYANDNFGRWESEFAALVQQCENTPGDVSRIARMLAPQAGDRSVLKPRHSAFYQTPLMFLLQTLGAQAVVLTGVSADSCIMFTAHDAYLRHLKLWIPSDCVASDAAKHTRAALAHMHRVLKARVTPAVA